MSLAEHIGFPLLSQPALCAETDPEEFFPDKGGSPVAAKRVCRACAAVDECLMWALDNPQWGVWGGTTEKERRAIQRRRGVPRSSGIVHGTDAGTKAHYRQGSEPCPACRQASRDARARRQRAA